MPTKTFKTIAKKSKKSVADMKRYWDRAEKSYKKQQAKARRGEREPIRDKHSYVMATTLRQAQGTGPYPHKPLGKKRKKTKKEEFVLRVDSILEAYLS